MQKRIFTVLIIFMTLFSLQLSPFAVHQAGVVHAKSTAPSKVKEGGKRKMNFNEGWRFKQEKDGSLNGSEKPVFDDSAWRQLDLPHDWSIEQDFNKDSPATHEGGYLDGGTGWYRKTFTIPESMKEKQIRIDFDGVYMNSTTYLNGKKLGTYPNGYTAFSYDLTDDLYTDGRENVLAVKVNNKQPSSRWYSGSGIYRNVHLTVTDPVHVARHGTDVKTPDLETSFKKGKADVNIKTKVTNDSDEATKAQLKSTIYAEDEKAVSTVKSDVKTLDPGTDTTFEDNTVIKNPKLWDVEHPYRYKLVTEVTVNGKVVDRYDTPFGLRYFKFDADDGFSLNGKYMKLHGVSMHHDQGALGAISNKRAIERQMKIMKDMGVNAIRSTHNPASPELIEVANELGLLVIDEAFDSWNQSKKEYDYSRFFSEWAEHDIKEMVDGAKNEPSIIMWSIGNEIYDSNNASGVTTAKNLVKWVKEIDTTRPTTIGEDKTRGDKVHVTPINRYIEEIFDIVDIVGLNYSENNYAGYHDEHPEWKLYGSETSSATRSRGVYTHPYDYNQSTGYEDLQQSSYDNDYVSWGRTAEDAWKYDRDLKHIAGQFIWTGFDYIGEPTPYYNSYPAKSSYFGAVDTAGFPKDIFYYYQSQWNEKPMVHLLPHWNWKDGEEARVLAYTNAHQVELFLNGESIGKRSYEEKKTSWGSTYKETKDGDTYLEWKVPFEPGTLEAVAKDEKGNIIAKDKVVTAGEPAKVRLSADRQVIDADGNDLSYITADIVDKDGNIVPDADQLIKFNVSGEGELAGVDNGNASSVERYKDDKRKAFHGKALAIVKSGKQADEITLKASAAGLSGDTANLFTIDPDSHDRKKIAGIDTTYVTVDVNEKPKLPSTIDVYYNDASIEEKQVTWEDIPPSLYRKAGKFTVVGSIEGTKKKAKAVVTVKDIVTIQNYHIATKVGVQLELPAKATILYSDATTKAVNVTWDPIPEDHLKEPSKFVVEGTVNETELKAKAQVRVTNESEKKNIMMNKTGAEFPKLHATFTGAGDSLDHINDGIKSYDDNPKNRWTSWTTTPRDDGDAITIDFGKKQVIDNLDLFVFTDRATVVPDSVTVSYWDGAEWKKVRNQTNPDSYTTKKNEVRFDAVSTDKLKFHMTPSKKGNFLALTEVEVYADQIEMGETADLGKLKINGKKLKGFDSKKHHYELTLPYGSKLPEIEAEGKDNASVTVLPAFSLPGKAIVYVTSEDGKKSSEYTIQMDTEEPQLVSGELVTDDMDIMEDDVIDLQVKGTLEDGETIDLTNEKPTYEFDSDIIKIKDSKLYAYGEGKVNVKATVSYKDKTVTTPALTIKIAKNPAEKHIEKLENIPITVGKGEKPTLPKTVKADYDTGLPRDVKVEWEDIDPKQYAELGAFTVYGKVANTKIKATATIIVKGPIAVETTATATLQNKKPLLPTERAVYYSDGSKEKVTVSWEEIPKEKLKKVGMFQLEGTMKGVDLKAKAKIRVTDKVGSEQNISRAKNGYEYPKAEASFTNRDATSNDRIEAINDDIISYEESPHNRWTNWQSVPRPGDWVSVTFGDYEPVAHDVDNLEIHWFGDHGTSYPESFNIQYKSGDKWIDVTNLRQNPSSPTLKEANLYTFDNVKTSAIRLDMKAQKDMGLAITELKVFSKWPEMNKEASVSDIQLDGDSILDNFKEKDGNFEYELKVSSMEDIPKITASGKNNTSITVIPSVTAPSTAKIIAVSEDGKQQEVYHIKLHVDKMPLEKVIDKATDRLTGTEGGSAPGQYPADARVALKNAIQVAKETLHRDSATLQDVSKALKMLQTAIKTYDAAKVTEVSIESMITQIEAYEKSGAFSNNNAAHALKVHLTAVGHYVKKHQAQKVVKHMKGFKSLLDQQKENKWITEKAYQQLMSDADHLLQKWK